MTEPRKVVYWDASAVLSLLFTDRHSAEALDWRRQEGAVHLLSTLAYVETQAVIARLEREHALAGQLAAAARGSLSTGDWRRTAAQPAWEDVAPFAARWPLRGADLWHLATAGFLHRRLPELHLLTFDYRLREAAEGEGLLQG